MTITTLAELEAEANSKSHGTDVYERIADMKAIIERLENIVYGKWSKGVDMQFQYNREIQRLIAGLKGGKE